VVARNEEATVKSRVSLEDLDHEETLMAIFRSHELDYKASFLPLIKSYAKKLLR
jgi:hypothetical protein